MGDGGGGGGEVDGGEGVEGGEGGGVLGSVKSQVATKFTQNDFLYRRERL